MKAVILDGYTLTQEDLDWHELDEICELTVYERTPSDKVIERIGDCDAVFTSKNKITREVMLACPNLKFVSLLATGYDNVDVKTAKERGIAVCNIPAYSTESVVQHTFALLLEIVSQVGLNNTVIQGGKWSNCKDFTFAEAPIIQLSGRSMGIIGYGTIGKRVAEVAKAFGMTVNIYSRDPEATLKSDVITLHCPATPDNKGFVNKEFIEKLKDGVIIINTARGALVNEQDLADAVKSGKVRACGIDVLTQEPPVNGNPLLGIDNVFVTAHIAWASKEARSVVTETAAKNLKAFMDGEKLNRVE